MGGQSPVKIIADTNVLVRAAVADDPVQAKIAADVLAKAEVIAVPVPVLCEFVWVLLRGYARSAAETAEAIRQLADSANVVLDRPAVEFGLSVLLAGGDFADGVIAFEGLRLGGSVFASFDRHATQLLAAAGIEVSLLPAV